MTELDFPLQRLIIYRNLLNDAVIGRTRQLAGWLQDPGRVAKGESESCFYSIWFDVIRKTRTFVLPDDPWRNYVLNLILEDENAFSLACEKVKTQPDSPVWPLAVHDLGILKQLYNLNWPSVAQGIGADIAADTACLTKLWPAQPSGHPLQRLRTRLMAGIHQLFIGNTDITVVVEALAEYYLTIGSGDMGKYGAFRWGQRLHGIENPDPIELDDLVGYEEQKKILLRNTEAFINGYRANNILLYGERGTGKSSSVKALLNRYACSGLRMIELAKSDLGFLGDIVEKIRERGFRFIIFLDDLSFEDFEVEYKHLKASIEGSLEATPDNVLLYVTSNRRHLVKETWRDRQSLDEEVHVSDSHQEKLSLVDRFGITICYPAPNQGQYLRIVQQLAQKHGLNLPDDDLKRKAIEWEMNYHGRSGRTAKQFITDLSAGK
ncbi:MAG: ATP-binding protein [Heliobacteriaceae bacterium]|nr:ATP-binding protein [Heliobacteriaceae bacterium]